MHIDAGAPITRVITFHHIQRYVSSWETCLYYAVKNEAVTTLTLQGSDRLLVNYSSLCQHGVIEIYLTECISVII